MTDNDALMRRAENQARLRRVLQLTQALSYLGWIGSQGLSQFEAFKPHAAILQTIGKICMPLWGLGFVGTMLAITYVKKTPELAALIDDERTRGLKDKLYAVSFWVLFLAVGLVYAATFFMDVDAKAIMPILVSLAVAVPGLTYAWLYRN